MAQHDYGVPGMTTRMNAARAQASPQFSADVNATTIQYELKHGAALAQSKIREGLESKHASSGIISAAPNYEEAWSSIERDVGHLLRMPSELYRDVSMQARTLPMSEALETALSSIYPDYLKNNIINLHRFAPSFYVQNISCSTNKAVMNQLYYAYVKEAKIMDTPFNKTAFIGAKTNDVEINFQNYQLFIYLLTLIHYVTSRSTDEMFINADRETIPKIISWCSTRKGQDIEYMLRGPLSSSAYTLDYVQKFNGLISPSNDISSITDYMSLTTLQDMNGNMEHVNQSILSRANAFTKLPNVNEAYIINIDTHVDCKFRIDSKQNLMIDCQGVDIGDSLYSEQANVKLDAKVFATKMAEIDPKNTGGKLKKLLDGYSSIKINELLINRNTYQSPLDVFDKIYVRFPGITLANRSNQSRKTGDLQIDGRFELRGDYYVFIPSRAGGVTYKTGYSNVAQFEFMITERPDELSVIKYNPFKLNVGVNDIFNVPVMTRATNASSVQIDNSIYLISLFTVVEQFPTYISNSCFAYSPRLGLIQQLSYDLPVPNIIDRDFEFTFDLDYIYTEFTGATPSSGYIRGNRLYTYENNRNKAFRVETNLLRTPWRKLDHMYSMYSLFRTETNALFIYSDSANLNDLQLRFADEYAEAKGIVPGEYERRMVYRYSLQIITTFKSSNLIVYSNDHGIKTTTVKINSDSGETVSRNIYASSEYLCQSLNDNIIMIRIDRSADDAITTYPISIHPLSSHAKMTLELN